MKIKLLKISKGINYLAGDLLCCVFIIIAFCNIKIDEITIRTVLRALVYVYPGMYLLHIFISKYNKFMPVSPSSLFIMLLCIYGLVSNQSKTKVIIYLLVAMIANLLIKEVLRILVDNTYFSERNKRTLYHEVGHYFISRHYKQCFPIEINIYDEENTDKDGDYLCRNVEDLEPYQFIVVLLGGYVTEKYLLNKQKIFTLEELQRVLVYEISGRDYKLDYSRSLISIFLDQEKLQEAVKDIIELLDYEKDNIDKFIKKNKAKKSIKIANTYS